MSHEALAFYEFITDATTKDRYEHIHNTAKMVRELCGSEEEYEKWVNIFNAPVGYEDYYEWDTGIAP